MKMIQKEPAGPNYNHRLWYLKCSPKQEAQ